ncbi:hypothetical protein [Enterobacter cloacae]|uniref:hypothetical protein n=1 Tax=Enterobacter cloacae TaxID=550 RepID=UPI00301B260E
MDESRKQFEAEMAKLGDCVDMRRAKNGDEEYMEWDVRLAWKMWQASRAAIEIGLLSDKRRMDWLVSKAVNVRDPMVYGSHSMFWSQAVTDEEDDYYETKLREQIDEAMDAESIRAAGIKVKE